MRRQTLALSALILGAALLTPVHAQDADRTVADGGIKVEGWKGRVDRRPASQGKTIKDSKLTAEGGNLRFSVGPAGNFWNPANTLSGNYEVMATFKEHKMAAAHPHSYGMFIGGKDLESDTETLMYCIVYANGEATNTVGWRVKDGQASCVVNGTLVKSLDKGMYVGDDKLTSTDGVYGVRVSHNLELTVSNIMKH